MRLTPLLILTLLVGCDRSDSSRPVEVGHIHSGNHSDEEYKALKLTVEEMNKDTGQLPQGRRIHIRHAQGGSAPEEWGAQATRLLELNRVTGLIGGDRWDQAERIGTAVQGQKVLAISPAGSAGATASENLFCVGLAPSERGRVLAHVTRESKQKKQVLVIRDPVAKAANLAADRFVTAIREADMTITEVEASTTSKFEADVVFLACSAAQTTRLRELAINQPMLLFGGDDAELSALVSSGKNAERVHVATAFHPEPKSERLAAFVARYQQAYQQPPTLTAILAHDAFSIWVEAARRAGGYDFAAMRTELLKREKPFDTLVGPLTFADDHTARRPVFAAQIKNGLLTDVRIFEAEVPK